MQTVTFNKPFKYKLEGGISHRYPANRPMEVSEAVASEARRKGYVIEEKAPVKRPTKGD